MILAPPIARRRRNVLAALIVTGLLVVSTPPAAAEPVPGSAGTDTSLPATDSQAIASGRGRFADLEIKVNQTRNLVNQAISVTWTGGTVTGKGPGDFARNYLQVMQCWGDDDGSVPENPGPPPEQCVQGAVDGVPNGRNGSVFPPSSWAIHRIVGQEGLSPGFDAADGYLDPRSGLLWKPFRSVDGTVVDRQADLDYDPRIGEYWLNPYFNHITTNEIAGGRTGQNGAGAELFEVNTGVESSGLGCGQAVQPVAGGSPTVPKCWLVVVPRGSAEEENVGSGHDPGRGVMTSPLAPGPWRNRIAIPLEFNSVDSPCSLSDDQRRLVGTELVGGAVASWQPKLCATPGLPPYAYGIVSDSAARQQLLGGATGAAGMVVVSRPIERSNLDAAKPVTYAPLSVSALVIGFNVERRPNPTTGGPAAEALRGVRVADLNLTPRLVAKLLTQSYRTQVAIQSVPPPYEWVRGNPADLGLDPDFLQFNPEFEVLQNGGKNFGGLVTGARNSDAGRQVWEWVLSDPEARAWLDGAPDAWGMKVNPVYATTAEANTSGAAFGDPIPDSFPKSDQYCYQGPPFGPSLVPPKLCGNDWLPYTQGIREAARLTRAADDGARTVGDPQAPRPDAFYKRDGPQVIGSRTFLSLTDSASAFQYGVQMARLSRAGDNEPGRAFIAPDVAGLTAGVESMAPRDEPAVLEPTPTAAGPSAYPLTALTYAAISPLSLDERARQEYAAFVDYAAGDGQVAGLEVGQLPRGFAPLPEPLRAQATAAARTIRELTPIAAQQGGSTATTRATPGATATAPASGGSRSAAGGTQTASAPPTAGSGGADPATMPIATPAPSTPLAKVLTPILALARSRFVLPGLVAVALLSALGALEISKRPRRALGASIAAAGRAPAPRAPGARRVGTALHERLTRRWPVRR